MLVKFDVVDASGNVLWGDDSDELAWGMGVVSLCLYGRYLSYLMYVHTHSLTTPPSHLTWPTTLSFI